MIDIDEMTKHYAICALWSSIGDDDCPLDDTHSIDDISPECMASMRQDCADFASANFELIAATGASDEQTGHDFWLTRNGHGAGFWDRGYGPIGDKLSDAARVYGEAYLYVGDDNLIHGG